MPSNCTQYKKLGSPKSGSPIQIVKMDQDNRQFVLDLKSLQNIIESIGDKPLVIISIAGDFRKGKSFLLNFFLRYLYTKSFGEDKNWLQNNGFPFKGFSSRGGSALDTEGIIMWSHPFILEQNGKEYAVLLMDTQGSFDTEHNIAETSKVFALSTLLSSIQIFNISHNLQENNFDNLSAFIEYGRLALEESGEKPFQKLLFVIRDWQSPYEYLYGFEGGNKLLDKILTVRDKQPLELQRVRTVIKSCFEEIDCFLMSHPGKSVATSFRFNGSFADIDSDFIDCLKTLVPKVLNSKNAFKKISGRQITANDLIEYSRAYVHLFSAGTLPEPKSILEATEITQNMIILERVKISYHESMNVFMSEDLSSQQLSERHKELVDRAINDFKSVKKFVGNEMSEPFLNELNNYLDTKLKYFKQLIEAKERYRTETYKNIAIGVGTAFAGTVGAGLVAFFGIGFVVTAFTTGCVMLTKLR